MQETLAGAKPKANGMTEFAHGGDSQRTCRALQQHLSEYLDDELSRAVCAELEVHLSACPGCRVLVDTTRRTIMLYRAHGREPMPPDAHARLIHSLHFDSLEEHK